MASYSSKKRQRSENTTDRGEKKLYVAKTPEKTVSMPDLSDNTVMETAEDRDSVSNEEPTLKEVLSAIQQLHVKFDCHTKEMAGVQNDLKGINDRLCIVEDSVENCVADISLVNCDTVTLKDEVTVLREIVCKQQVEIRSLQERTLDLQARSMRCNLLFHNIPETKNENCETILHKQLKSFGLENIKIERTHRLGQQIATPKNPRPIIAKFSDTDCTAILSRVPKKHPGDGGLRVTRQFPLEYREKRNKMWEVADSYKKLDNNCKTRITTEGKLFVNGQLHKEKWVKPDVRSILEITGAEKNNLLEKNSQYEGTTIIERGCSFVASVTEVQTLDDARRAYQAFLVRPGRLAARHNIGVYRLYSRETAKTEEDWCDDDDHGAGRFLKNLLHQKNLTNIAVFLSRGTDGTHLGSRRFHLMQQAVESALKRFLSKEGSR